MRSSPMTLISVLKACGNDLTRTNVMRQAANIRDQKLPMILPWDHDIEQCDDFAPIKQMQLAKFDGAAR